jgi:hypothetical protein
MRARAHLDCSFLLHLFREKLFEKKISVKKLLQKKMGRDVAAELVQAGIAR